MIETKHKMLQELNRLRAHFDETISELEKDVERSYTTIERSDKRQKRDFIKLKELNQEIENTQQEILLIIGSVCEGRSKETGNHVKRVAEYIHLFATYSHMSPTEVSLLKQASPMHDIGKVAIPDHILNKPGKHTPEEFEIMKTHAQLGYEMLRHSQRKLLKIAAIIAHEHHEKWNGEGYPRSLKGEGIHIYGRITAIADVFDALSSKRVYKPSWSDEEVIKMISSERGEHFDPTLVDIFLEHIPEFLEIKERLSD